jgi:hypothetical protein
MSGEHRGSYSGLLIGASSVLTPRETAAICPFDLEAGLPADEVDLKDVTVEEFSVPRKYARPQARQGLEAREQEACRQRYVPGRSRNMRVNVKIEGLGSKPVLLPVFVLAYRYKEKVYRFLANGQTGKCTGTTPTSYKKLGILVGLLILGGLLLAGIIGMFN